MLETFGAQREALLARELSKTFETLKRAPLAELAGFVAGDSNQQRGEIVLAVAGQRRRDDSLSPDTQKLLLRLAQELPAKRATTLVAELTGLRKKQLYDFLLEQRQST